MEVIIAIIFGGVIGFVAGVLITRRVKPDGVLRIDHSNPAKDTYRFEIDEIEQLSKKTYIQLKVDNDAVLSQD